MSIAEVQSRIAVIAGQLGAITPQRAPLDPLAADAFRAQLGEATTALLGRPAAAGPGVPVDDADAFARALQGVGVTGAGAGVPLGATDGPGSSRSGGPTGDDVVAAARRYLGVPYRWGGTDPRTGLDCSGLVQRVFADLGIRMPRVVADQRNEGTEVPSLAQARPGDLIAFTSAGSPSGRHIGIYVGDGKMLHAPRSGEDVQISKVWDGITTIRRIVPSDDGQPAAAQQAASVTSAATRPAWAAAGGDLASVFRAATERYDLPAGLLQAVARRESGMDTRAVSPAGALGLMQLMPGTARELGVDPLDPAQAVDGAARYLRQQLDTFGSLELALAAYNAGPGNVRRYDGIPPFRETQDYVAAITRDLRGA